MNIRICSALSAAILATLTACEVPSGAVIAFDSACPTTGWASLENSAGRFIVGSSASTKPVGGIGGNSNGGKITISIAEMPSHSHKTRVRDDTASAGNQDQVPGTRYRFTDDGWRTKPEGGGQPVDIMPPYIAMNWCKKL